MIKCIHSFVIKDDVRVDKRIDLICQHTMEGKIIPLKLRFQDEDGELQEYSVKGYRDTSEFGITSFECKIIVRDTMKFVRIFSSVPEMIEEEYLEVIGDSIENLPADINNYWNKL